MKEEIMKRLFAVINSLDDVSVKGEQNMDNVTGSIKVIREVMTVLNNAEITEKKTEKAKIKQEGRCRAWVADAEEATAGSPQAAAL